VVRQRSADAERPGPRPARIFLAGWTPAQAGTGVWLRRRPPPWVWAGAGMIHARRLLVVLPLGPILARLGPGARLVALISAAHACRVALIWPARAGVAGPGEAQEGFVRLEAALPSRLDNQHRTERGRTNEVHIRSRGHRHGPAQALSNRRGHVRERDHPRRWPVRHRPRRLRRLAAVWQAVAGPARVRAAPGSASTSPTGCSPTVNRSSTSRRSCRRGHGCSRPGRAARPTPLTRTRSLWSALAWRACVRWSTTNGSRCCGSWLTAAGRWVRSTPGWCRSCTSCCWN